MAKTKGFEPLLWELVGGIPDPGDIGLAGRCGGDLRSAAFSAAEQWARVLASFPAGMVRAGIYFDYDPTRRRERRTRVKMAAFCREEAGEGTREALRLLFESGPWQGVYGGMLEDAKFSDAWLPVENYRACHRILRREEHESVREERYEHNHRLRGLNAYYAVHPFQPREDNDWLGLDRILDRMQHPAMVEILGGPAPKTSLRGAQGDFLYWLTQINSMESPMDRHIAEEARRRLLATLQQDPAADQFVKWNEETAEGLRQPQLIFGLRCWSACPEEGQLLTSIVAEECFEEGSYGIERLSEGDDELNRARRAAGAMAIIPLKAKTLFDPASAPDGVGDAHLKALALLPMTCSPDQLKSVLRLPVARAAASPRSLYLHTDPEPSEAGTWTDAGPSQESSFLIGEDLEVAPASLTKEKLSGLEDLGVVFREPDAVRAEIRLERKLLQKHLFVCGVPGSGKTTAMFNLVAQLYYQQTPFLIIEPAKTEYRMFKKFRHHPSEQIRKLASEMRVYTLGDERVSPFRFNPMLRGEDVTVEEHIGALMACFRASMPIDGPLEGILQEALAEVFTNPPENRQPRLSDLLSASLSILRAKGYDEEITSNLRAALEVRLGLLTKGSLGKVLECDENVPDRDILFTSPVVVEMDLLSQKDACLMTLLLLTALRQYLRANSRSGAPLKHVVFLEEAHNIAGRGAEGGDGADPRKHAAEFIARMLAEVRALGEGMIIADQLPSAVAPEVIKNTGSKLALRLVANDDREELGGTMLLDEAGIAELARLRVGQGFFYREGYYRPRRVQTLNSHAVLSATTLEGEGPDGKPVRLLAEFEPPERSELIDLMQEDAWFADEKVERAILSKANECLEAAVAIDDLNDNLVAARNRLVGARQTLLKGGESEPLSESVFLLVEQIDRAKHLVAEQVTSMVEIVRDFGSKEAAESRMPRLLDVVDAVFEESIRALLGRVAEAEVFLWTAEVLLEQRQFDEIANWPSVFSEESAQKPLEGFAKEEASEIWTLHQKRAVQLTKELFVDFQPWPRPPEPPEIPEEPTKDDVRRLNEEYYNAVCDALLRIDGIAYKFTKLKVILNYFSADKNPLVALLVAEIGEHKEPIGKLEQNADLGGQMLVLWLEHLSHTLNISLELNRITEAVKAENPN